MNILDSLFFNTMIILFPLFCYFLFAIDEQNMGKKTSSILFDLALYTSFYLLIKCDIPYAGIKEMFLAVPLLIAYLRNKKLTVILFSVVLALYYVYYIKISNIFVVLEFIIYFISIYLLRKRNESDVTIISAFAIIKIAFIIMEIEYISPSNLEGMKWIIILPLAFYFTTHMICYLMMKSEQAMSLHMTIKELERQKQLRDSLFKITHEIKNPIAVCKGYLDMFDPSNADHVKRYIPIIKQEIERTLTLMNDFMTLTKLNVDKRKLDISVLLQDVCEIAYLLCKNKNIKFTCSIIDEEVYIDGDYDRLKQVFINIIKNSIESITVDQKGHIKFKARIVRKEIIITIIDNGVGMDEKTLSKIGEAFFTTKSGGTGLGVRFSKEIIDAHNGSIDYKSKLNMGTTVNLTLPLKKSLL